MDDRLFGIHVLSEAAKQAGEPCIPLVPVVTSANGVKLESKVTRSEQRSELAVCGKQAFLLAAGQKKIWSRFWIRGPDQDERIVVAAGLASGWTENRVVVARLLEALDRKRTAGNVDRRTESARENEKIGMTQREFHRTETSHGEADDRAVRTAGCNGKLTFHIGDEVSHDVVFVAILRRVDGVRVIR